MSKTSDRMRSKTQPIRLAWHRENVRWVEAPELELFEEGGDA